MGVFLGSIPLSRFSFGLLRFVFFYQRKRVFVVSKTKIIQYLDLLAPLNLPILVTKGGFHSRVPGLSKYTPRPVEPLSLDMLSTESLKKKRKL